MRWRRLTLVLGLVVLSTASCTGGRGHATRASLARASTTSTILDPYAVPDTVDIAYVNRVLAALDAANGDLLRLYLRERRITPEIARRIVALYGSGGGYDFKVSVLEADRDTKPTTEPGNRVSTVSRLITATPSCIYVEVHRDYRPVAGSPGIPIQWVGHRPAPFMDEAVLYNPTHWIYTADGYIPDHSQPPNPCTAS